MSIHIGAHPLNLTLTALTHEPDLRGKLERSGLDVHFHWYAEGRLIHNALDNGEINVVGTGSTRAIVAQADDVRLYYIAASKPRTTGAAILVRNDSTIQSPSDLAGRRVGLIDGSFHTYFLVAAADSAASPIRQFSQSIGQSKTRSAHYLMARSMPGLLRHPISRLHWRPGTCGR